MTKKLLGSQEEIEKLKAYAEYVVKRHDADSKRSNDEMNVHHELLPIDILCTVYPNNIVEKRLFEFNIVNHFLKNNDIKTAIEIVKCMLLLWKNEDDKIISFDLNVIEPYLKEIERKFMEDIKKGLTENNKNKDQTNENKGENTNDYLC